MDWNWLWAIGAAIAVWLVLQSMSRQQSRLTQTLRDHVERTQSAQRSAAEAVQKPAGGSGAAGGANPPDATPPQESSIEPS